MPVIATWSELASLVSSGSPRGGAPRVIAIDGGSGAGKSTVAARLAEALDDAPVVHTDDVAWNHHPFDWAHLLRERRQQVVRGPGRDPSAHVVGIGGTAMVAKPTQGARTTCLISRFNCRRIGWRIEVGDGRRSGRGSYVLTQGPAAAFT